MPYEYSISCFITVDYSFFRNYLPYLLTIITFSLHHSGSATWWRVIANPSKPIKFVPDGGLACIHRKLNCRVKYSQHERYSYLQKCLMVRYNSYL